MADTIKKAEEFICNLTNNVDQALAVLSLGIDSLPTVNFDSRKQVLFMPLKQSLKKYRT